MPASTEAATGRGKLVLVFGNMFAGYGPHAVSWYDGYAFTPPERQGERTGLKYLLDAIETYELPLTSNDMRVDVLAANDYLGINDRLRSLAQRGLFDPLPTLTYGYFMPWQQCRLRRKSLLRNLRRHLPSSQFRPRRQPRWRRLQPWLHPNLSAQVLSLGTSPSSLAFCFSSASEPRSHYVGGENEGSRRRVPRSTTTEGAEK